MNDQTSNTGAHADHPESTLGWSLFRDPLTMAFCVADIRQRLELKFCACLALDGLNGYPVDTYRIKDPRFRKIGACSRLLKNWSAIDLTNFKGSMAIPAESVLLAMLENPIWGEDDVQLLGLLEQVESLQYKAENGGLIL